jgi:ABC-type uncharacterized transport system ATPase subunit
MESLKVERLRKSFGGLILDGVSLSVQTGEYVAVIGPNGAGKTTLLNVITGELSADSGRLYLLGKDVTAMPTYERIQTGLGHPTLLLSSPFSLDSSCFCCLLLVCKTKRPDFPLSSIYCAGAAYSAIAH